MPTQGFYGYQQDNIIKGIKLQHDAYINVYVPNIIKLIQKNSDQEIINLWVNQIVLLTERAFFDDEFNFELEDLENNFEKIFEINPLKLNVFNKIFQIVKNKKQDKYYFADGDDFYKNGIFCNMSAILNFDTKALDIYKCYNLNPDTGHEDWYFEDVNNKPFYNNLMCSISFANIRSEDAVSIIKNLENTEEEFDAKKAELLIDFYKQKRSEKKD